MKGSKAVTAVIWTLLGILGALVLLGGIACAFAGLVMLLWNVLGVAALSVAVSLTFLTALKGVSILYGLVAVWNIIRAVIQSYLHKRAIHLMLEGLREQGGKKEEDGDILGDFFRKH